MVIYIFHCTPIRRSTKPDYPNGFQCHSLKHRPLQIVSVFETMNYFTPLFSASTMFVLAALFDGNMAPMAPVIRQINTTRIQSV